MPSSPTANRGDVTGSRVTSFAPIFALRAAQHRSPKRDGLSFDLGHMKKHVLTHELAHSRESSVCLTDFHEHRRLLKSAMSLILYLKCLSEVRGKIFKPCQEHIDFSR